MRNFVGAICRGRGFTIDCVGTGYAVAGQTAMHASTQQFMLRGRLKTVDSYRTGRPNRDKPHFGDA
jgi:hypothetical protein